MNQHCLSIITIMIKTMLSLHSAYQLFFLSVHAAWYMKHQSMDRSILLFLAPTPTCFERALLNPVTLMKLAPSVTGTGISILSP